MTDSVDKPSPAAVVVAADESLSSDSYDKGSGSSSTSTRSRSRKSAHPMPIVKSSEPVAPVVPVTAEQENSSKPQQRVTRKSLSTHNSVVA